MIKIKLAELKRIQNRSIDVHEELASSLTKINANLNDICQNVNSTSLTNSTAKITKSISELITIINSNLQGLNNFMEQQLSTYTQTNVNTENALNSLASSISSTLNNF